MNFSIYPDWWQPLSEQVGGDERLEQFSPGDHPDISPGDPSSHPRVDESGKVTESAIYSALLQQYTSESIDAFDASADSAADLRRHARAIALYDLTSYGGQRPEDISVANTNALGWLKNVREGTVTIVGLDRIGGAGGGGGVTYKARRRVFDGSSCEFRRRNEPI